MFKTFHDPIRNKDWTVRIVRNGEAYGRNDCLINTSADPLVEFYDTNQTHTIYGQFVSRYFLSTLLHNYEAAGICLDGGVPAWSISAEGYDEIHDWLEQL